MKKLSFLLILLPLFFVSCEKNNGLIVLKSEIKYKVSGTASEILVTYTDEKGDIVSTGISGENIPWTYSFDAKPNTYVYLQGVNTGSDGDVKVEIMKKKKTLFNKSNNSPYGSVTVSGYTN